MPPPAAGSYISAGATQRVFVINSGSEAYAIAQGQVAGVEAQYKFGRNPDIDIATAPEDFWNPGGLYTGQPDQTAAAETVDVSSDSPNDTAAGTGARTIVILGLDENWLEQEEIITMNGLTNVTSVNLWHRVFRVYVLTGGSTGANEGLITVRHTTTVANVFSVMTVGSNQSTIGAYTVPAGKTMYLTDFHASLSRASGAAGSAVISLRVRPQGGVYRAFLLDDITDAESIDISFDNPLVIDPRSDIIVRCESVSDNATSLSTVFQFVLIS